MCIKRSFTLVEVIISFMLLSLSLVFLLPPLSNAGKNMREQAAHMLIQNIADEELNNIYAQIYQTDTLKKEQFETLFSHQNKGLYSIDYRIRELETKGKESTYVGLCVEMEIQHTAFLQARATRNCYLCAKLGQ